MPDTLEDILAADYLDDVGSVAMDQLRRRRADCTEIETGLSYVRRLAQGRLDVVAAERSRRADGEGGDDLESLIERLPGLLAGSTRSPGVGRLPADIGMGSVDQSLIDELDEIVSASRLGQPDELDDRELDEVSAQLEDFERRVSALRRRLFEAIDAFEAEMARRYQTGEASVDNVLRGPA